MRTLTALASLATALALAGPAAAGTGLRVGVVDDSAKGSLDSGASFFAQMADVGMTENRVTVVWDPANPAVTPEAESLSRLMPVAMLRGIRVVFAVYPAKARAVTDSPAAPAQFAAFLQYLARTNPLVKDFIVGNEPNQTRFWQPQFNPNGAGAACKAYESLLARSYDALKTADAGINVIGVGLSPRGNDDPGAESNVSTSPVRCLRDLGAAFRESGRKKPLMDEFSFHPYPKFDTDALKKGYRWPNAGIPNLHRIKQAMWDAFHGTAQPTFPESGKAGKAGSQSLRFRLDEVGWQVGVLPSLQSSYVGKENIRTTSEPAQAAIYGDLVRFLACDASVGSVLFFGLRDEAVLEAWQAGLQRVDGSSRPSYDAVKAAIAQTGGGCKGKPHTWRHTESVVGAGASFGNLKPKLLKNLYWAFNATAQEDATYRAGIFRASTGRGRLAGRLASGKGAVLSTSGEVKAYWTPLIKFPGKKLKRGKYVFAIQLSAAMNPARKTLLFSRPFRVGLSR